MSSTEGIRNSATFKAADVKIDLKFRKLVKKVSEILLPCEELIC